MRVGFLVKQRNAEAEALSRELEALLAGRGHASVVVDASGEEPGDPDGAAASLAAIGKLDLLVVLGGDGTLLRGAQLVADDGVPILGINHGTLGFLTSCRPEQAGATLTAAIDGQLPVESRMRLRVQITRGGSGDGPIVRYACNDAVLSQGSLARLIEIDARLDGTPIATYRADGLIIATPTGSTAYNLASGGPILAPTVDGMVISPICPHTLTNRPLVVPGSCRVRLQPREGSAQLTVDGQWGTPIGPDDVLELRAANRPLRLYRPADMSYFDILRAKLHWGEIYARATSDRPRR